MNGIAAGAPHTKPTGPAEGAGADAAAFGFAASQLAHFVAFESLLVKHTVHCHESGPGTYFAHTESTATAGANTLAGAGVGAGAGAGADATFGFVVSQLAHFAAFASLFWVKQDAHCQESGPGMYFAQTGSMLHTLQGVHTIIYDEM